MAEDHNNMQHIPPDSKDHRITVDKISLRHLCVGSISNQRRSKGLCYLGQTDAYFDGLVQDCSNSIANALELLQSCTKPSICGLLFVLEPYGMHWELS